VVIAVLALCAATLLPALARTKSPAQRIYCANNLKGNGEAFHIWSQDHGGTFPTRVAIANGGCADFIGLRTLASVQSSSRGVFWVFLCLSNELRSPKVLICPAENEPRLAATTFAGVIPPDSPGLVPLTNDLNVSYFVGVDAAETTPLALLAGDHNLGADGKITPLIGFVTAPSVYHVDFKVSLGNSFTTNGGVGWLKTMHSNQGNILVADGSVRLHNRVQLQNALRNSGSNANLGGGPLFGIAIGCSGININRIQFP